MSKLSEWQTGKPPCDGIWEIEIDGRAYFSRFKHGEWGIGWNSISYAYRADFYPISFNNDPKKPRRWRGVLAEPQSFEEVTRPVIEWLNANCHPHHVVVIEHTGAVLYEGAESY